MPKQPSPPLLRSQTRAGWPLALAALSLLVAVFLAACGGGSEVAAPSTPTVVLSSVSYAQGAISGFGSVIVGGVRYDDSRASVVDADGTALPASRLGLGSMVMVDAGPVDRSSATAVASRFQLCDEVLGPVSSVNTAAGSLVVLGQTVLVDTSTVFGSSLAGGLSAALVGSVVDVQGAPDATSGQITATRIEPATAATSYALRGTVAALDTTAKTFQIGAATIAYGSLPAASVPAGLANGLIVRARLSTTPVSGNWVATALRADPRQPTSPTDSHIEGAITVFTSTTAFQIGGVKVDASAATFTDGTSGIVLGALVEVTGTLSNGTLVATQVELEDKPSEGGMRPIELHGALSGLDTTAQTFALRSVKVSYAGAVSYKNGTVADLANGKNVDVYGVLSSDRQSLAARSIVFH